jgi:hypothetical protein
MLLLFVVFASVFFVVACFGRRNILWAMFFPHKHVYAHALQPAIAFESLDESERGGWLVLDF